MTYLEQSGAMKQSLGRALSDAQKFANTLVKIERLAGHARRPSVEKLAALAKFDAYEAACTWTPVEQAATLVNLTKAIAKVKEL